MRALAALRHAEKQDPVRRQSELCFGLIMGGGGGTQQFSWKARKGPYAQILQLIIYKEHRCPNSPSQYFTGGAGLRELPSSRRAGRVWGQGGERGWGGREASPTGVAMEHAGREGSEVAWGQARLGQSCSGKMVVWERGVSAQWGRRGRD